MSIGKYQKQYSNGTTTTNNHSLSSFRMGNSCIRDDTRANQRKRGINEGSTGANKPEHEIEIQKHEPTG